MRARTERVAIGIGFLHNNLTPEPGGLRAFDAWLHAGHHRAWPWVPACACSRRAPVLSAQSAQCWPGTVAVPGYCESLPIIMDLQAFRAELAAAKEVRTAV